MSVVLTVMDKASYKYMPGKYLDEPTTLGIATWNMMAALIQQGLSIQ